MPINIKPVSIRIAVLTFFIASIVCVVNGLQPFTCCKRALIAAVISLFASCVILRIINAVLINAITHRLMSEEKEKQNGS
jgi:hypothetical protein